MRNFFIVLLFFPFFLSAQSESPYPGASYLEKGMEKRMAGDHIGAIADFDKQIKMDPNEIFAYLARAGSRYDLNDFNSAISDLNKVIKLDPNHTLMVPKSFAYAMRGRAKYQLKKFSAAMADYDMAIKLEPDNAELYKYRGSCRVILDYKIQAIADFKKGCDLGDEKCCSLEKRLRKEM